MSITLSKQITLVGEGLSIATIEARYICCVYFVIYTGYTGVRHSLVHTWPLMDFIGVYSGISEQ